MPSAADYRFMGRALQLAERGLYGTDPNPRVGCVLVQGDRIVGEGWHQKAGEAHAEVYALAAAGDQAAGATAYVTLEPCCHHGKTPPCADALLRAGVSRVVAAMQDPNPRVAGNGLARLAQAGVAVEVGVLEAQAEALNPGFIRRMREGRPLVRCKLAMSLDGRTAMASGQSKWITGAAAREDVHRLRARSSAIVTGVGTVLADNPFMNVRLPDFGDWARVPLRVVLDPDLKMPAEAAMLALPGRTLVLTTSDDEAARRALETAGAEVVRIAGSAKALDLAEVCRYLASDEQANELLLESGATLSGAMLQAGLIDELICYVAPHLMGDGARGLFHLPGVEQMDQRIELEIRDIRPVGGDWRITAVPRR